MRAKTGQIGFEAHRPAMTAAGMDHAALRVS
jgi:hypothetical protein